jgi:hypothetical protein
VSVVQLKGVHTVMRLIHKPHHDLTFSSILLGQLLPQSRKIVIGRSSTLTDDIPVPAGIIMNIDNAMRASLQTSLHQDVILGEIRRVKSPTELVVDQVLPGDGQPEDVEFVFSGEVGHLAWAIPTVVFVSIAVLADWTIDIC